jgi:hypothetical protein
MLTHYEATRLLSYDPETGEITWRVKRGYMRAGSKAGCIGVKGYAQIGVSGRTYPAHRLAWLLHFGAFPPEQLDHINGDRADNRIANLRACTNTQNQQNVAIRVGVSGHIGVTWHKRSGKWHARIKHERKRTHLGQFDSIEDAAAAYQAAKRELHTFHPELRAGLR